MKILHKKKGFHLLLALVSTIYLFNVMPGKITKAFNLEKSIYINEPIIVDENKQLKVHFIDVGDADCILIQQGNNSMLIDAGNNKDQDIIKEYLSRQGINKLDILVGTHIHEDHIGSMDFVINEFDIGKIIMPKCDTKNKDLENVLLSVKNKGLSITESVAGETFKIGDADCTILAPASMGYEKLNDYSIVIKLKYGNTSFLFTGDAESTSEHEMMRRGFDLASDVLKLSHHGSASSTCKEFLNRVNPKYAVLIAGRDNEYFHPHKTTMKKLKEKKIEVYRTDESGTIVATSDGKSIYFDKNPGSYFYKGK